VLEESQNPQELMPPLADKNPLAKSLEVKHKHKKTEAEIEM
jgi:hypothetical protein